MPRERKTFGPLDTDSPPDQVGDKAIALKNMLPASATGIKPRAGSSLVKTFAAVGAPDKRRIYVWIINGDTTYSTFIACINEASSVVTVEALFQAHLGQTAHAYLDTLTNDALLVKSISAVAAGLTGPFTPTVVQYGNKAFVYYPDQRPIVVMAGPGSVPTAYDCGIYPPQSYPSPNASSVDADNLAYDDTSGLSNTLYFAYAYHSTARGTFSQPSPVQEYKIPAPTVLTGTVAIAQGSKNLVGTGTAFATGSPAELVVGSNYTIGGYSVTIATRTSNTVATITTQWIYPSVTAATMYAAPKQIVISGMFWPRDDFLTQGIDEIVFGVQSGTNPGLMCRLPEMSIKFALQVSGTISVSAGSATVTGSNTNFDPEVVVGGAGVVGDSILIGGAWYRVTARGAGVLADTELTISPVAAVAALAGSTTYRRATLTGTVSTTITGTAAQRKTITGTGTGFLLEVALFDSLFINGVSYFVTAVASDTSLTVSVVAPTAGSGLIAYHMPRRTFDFSPDQLAPPYGFNLNDLAGSVYVPPAVKHAERYGERIWTAGQVPRYTFSGSTLDINPSRLTGSASVVAGATTINGSSDSLFQSELDDGDIIEFNGRRRIVATRPSQTQITITSAIAEKLTSQPMFRLYRGGKFARLDLDGGGVFNSAQLYFSLYVRGRYIGEIFDLNHGNDQAWLDRDAELDLVGDTAFEIIGHNERIWPSGYDLNVPGGVPTPFPECCQVNQYFLLTQALDQGQQLVGLRATQDDMRIFFDQSLVRMTGGLEIGSPEPDLRQYQGRTGAISSRSICKAPTGEMAWIGSEGLFLDDGGGSRNVSVELGCQALFRGGQWIARANVPTIPMTYCREMNGFVFGNFTINGVANWWGLFTIQPQYGIWLFDNQTIASNFIEYLDSNGQGRILAGDARGRVKRLLDDTLLVDLNLTADTSADYTCRWREGYQQTPEGKMWSAARISFPGIIAPTSTPLALTVSCWRSHLPQREEGRLSSDSTYSVPVTEKDLAPDGSAPLNPNRARFQSIAIEYSSSTGSYSSTLARPMEITRWLLSEGADK